MKIPHVTSRRSFLRDLSAAAATTLTLGPPRLVSAVDASSGSGTSGGTADQCILLWLAGGMAAPETFDPKRYRPFEIGMPVAEMLSTFPAIPTAVDGLEISAGMPEIAAVMDRGTLIRSAVQPDLGSILHSRHQYHWHTGYVPPQSVACPHLGAWMAKVLGPIDPVMPAFVNLGQRLEGVGEKEELKAFTTGGFFGSEFGPMNLPFPAEAAASVSPPKGMNQSRFANRDRLMRQLVETSTRANDISDFHRDSMLRSFDNAYRLLSSEKRRAFDLQQTSIEDRERYDTGRFGQGCLLARELVRSGVRFVEVTTEYVPFLHWDTHANGHATTERLHGEIDRPIAQLIRDLESDGLLDRTLVIVASEFSRDAILEGRPGSNANDQATFKVETIGEPKHYGLHRHFTGGTSVAMFGGGMRRGFVYGKTADERPLVAIENPVTVTDLHATILKAMGIPANTQYEIEGRPFYVTEDGKGEPVDAVFA